MTTYLDRIIEAHRRAAARDQRPVAELAACAEGAPSPRPFLARLTRATGLAVIAEIKRRSPSKGAIRPGLDPGDLASRYETGGADCLSVLTDEEFFGGSASDLVAARQASGLPVLRKDFTVCERDVYDARIMGADCILLIVAALDQAELESFLRLGRDLGMDVLVEIHDEVELGRATEAGADLVGVNQRDLGTFEVDRGRAALLASHLPPRVMKVAESGIRGPEDCRELADAGFEAVLVGESLVRARDPAAAVAALRAAGGPGR